MRLYSSGEVIAVAIAGVLLLVGLVLGFLNLISFAAELWHGGNVGSLVVIVVGLSMIFAVLARGYWSLVAFLAPGARRFGIYASGVGLASFLAVEYQPLVLVGVIAPLLITAVIGEKARSELRAELHLQRWQRQANTRRQHRWAAHPGWWENVA